MQHTNLDRRGFIKAGAGGALAGGLLPAAAKAQPAAQAAEPNAASSAPARCATDCRRSGEMPAVITERTIPTTPSTISENGISVTQ